MATQKGEIGMEFCCPHCGKRTSLKNKPEYLGKKTQCKGCGKIFTLNQEALRHEEDLEQTRPIPVPQLELTTPISDKESSTPEQKPGLEKEKLASKRREPRVRSTPLRTHEPSDTPWALISTVVLIGIVISLIFYILSKKSGPDENTRELTVSEKPTPPPKKHVTVIPAENPKPANNEEPAPLQVSTKKLPDAQDYEYLLQEKDNTVYQRYTKLKACEEFCQKYPQTKYLLPAQEMAKSLESDLQNTAETHCRNIEEKINANQLAAAWELKQSFLPELKSFKDTLGEEYQQKLQRLEEKIVAAVVAGLEQECATLKSEVPKARFSQRWQDEAPETWQEWLKYPRIEGVYKKSRELYHELQTRLQNKANEELANAISTETQSTEKAERVPEKAQNKQPQAQKGLTPQWTTYLKEAVKHYQRRNYNEVLYILCKIQTQKLSLSEVKLTDNFLYQELDKKLDSLAEECLCACEKCNSRQKLVCPTCNGARRVRDSGTFRRSRQEVDCTACQAKGTITCPYCAARRNSKQYQKIVAYLSKTLSDYGSAKLDQSCPVTVILSRMTATSGSSRLEFSIVNSSDKDVFSLRFNVLFLDETDKVLRTFPCSELAQPALIKRKSQIERSYYTSAPTETRKVRPVVEDIIYTDQSSWKQDLGGGNE